MCNIRFLEVFCRFQPIFIVFLSMSDFYRTVVIVLISGISKAAAGNEDLDEIRKLTNEGHFQQALEKATFRTAMIYLLKIGSLRWTKTPLSSAWFLIKYFQSNQKHIITLLKTSLLNTRSTTFVQSISVIP